MKTNTLDELKKSYDKLESQYKELKTFSENLEASHRIIVERYGADTQAFQALTGVGQCEKVDTSALLKADRLSNPLFSKPFDLNQIENELNIANSIFECEFGVIVTDASERILKVNNAFSDLTGFLPVELINQTPSILRSGLHDKSFYSALWDSVYSTGSWKGEIWNLRKNGEEYLESMTIKAVKDDRGFVTNYVATVSDSRRNSQQELLRLAEESAHRETLISEVHHRIKNNLQGVTGLLSDFAAKHSELSGKMNDAISQIQSIAIIHGLQGRSTKSKVRLCELTREIASNNDTVWKNAVLVDIPSNWIPYVIDETDAVPIALVINELISNAIKHGDKSKAIKVKIMLQSESNLVRLTISNFGHLPADFGAIKTPGYKSGLKLISSLLPEKGMSLTYTNSDNIVTAQLDLEVSILTLNIEGNTNI